MSMNLYFEAGDEELDTWQTPTNITYLCLATNKGKVPHEVTGKKARRALHMYRLWVFNQSLVFDSTSEAAMYNTERRDHDIEIKSFLEKPGLKAYMQ